MSPSPAIVPDRENAVAEDDDPAFLTITAVKIVQIDWRSRQTLHLQELFDLRVGH